MSAVVNPGPAQDPIRCLHLLSDADESRIIAWRRGRAVRAREFLGDVALVARMLPDTGHAINLCDDRYLFLVGFCAAASLGHATLLPSSRAAQAILDVRAAYADTYVLGEARTCHSLSDTIRLPDLDTAAPFHAAGAGLLDIVESQTAAVGFTSGSTGVPKANAKTWRNFSRGSALNAAMLAAAIGLEVGEVAHVLATVPAQHMYGMELSILLPLFGPFSVHSGKPLFPADIAAELASLPSPRILVTTPIHLQALLRESVALPQVAAIVSATAPLSIELAAEAEARFQAPLIEMFGSTETCVIAHRRTAVKSLWTLYPGIELSPQPDGTMVVASHLSSPVQLQDIVELHPDHQFRLCGRNADLLEIAGKRASLADLTRRLMSLEGVVDAVVFQLDGESSSGVRRIAALAVAPGCSEKELLNRLRDAIDPLFLPRPLRLVDALPRNETGKLPRAALLAAIEK
jgi:acyl-coenzyme A synthetase/AMP-(fatty) acid ligase